MHELGSNKAEHTIENKEINLIFVHSPFCGTCHLARKMLLTLEALYEKEVFKEMNASLYPTLMEEHKIKSVPCLLVTKDGRVLDKVYAFHSVPFLYEKVSNYVK